MTKRIYRPEIRVTAYSVGTLRRRLDFIEAVDLADLKPCPPRTGEMRAIRAELARREALAA